MYSQQFFSEGNTFRWKNRINEMSIFFQICGYKEFIKSLKKNINHEIKSFI